MSAQVKACDVQMKFDNGTSHFSCHTRWSHPIHSIKVSKKCKACECKAQVVDGRLSKIKGLLTELNDTMERIKGGPARESMNSISAGGVVASSDKDTNDTWKGDETTGR